VEDICYGMVRTFLKVYMELGTLFLQEQIKDIIIDTTSRGLCGLVSGTKTLFDTTDAGVSRLVIKRLRKSTTERGR
jgi:hypothetical protein